MTRTLAIPLLCALGILGAVRNADAQPGAESAAGPTASPSEREGEESEGVSAEPSETAYRETVLQAIDEYERALYAEALASFTRAYQLRPSARVLRGMGKSLFELRRYADAARRLREALQSTVDPLSAPLRAEVQDLIQRATRYLGQLRVIVEPPEAELRIDGRVSESGATLSLDTGEHTVVASAAGFDSESRQVSIEPTETVDLEIRLNPIGTGPSVVVAPSDPTPLLVVGLALSIAGGAGIIASSAWFANRDDAVATCNAAAARGARCENGSSIATGRDLSLWMIGLSATTALAGGAFLVAYVLSGADEADGRHDALTCVPTLEGVQCRATW